MANFFENAGSVLTAASEGAQDPGAAAERQAKQQAAVVGAAQMVLQNPNATEEQVKAASAAMEKNGFDPIMVQGLRPGPAAQGQILPSGAQVPGGGAVPEGFAATVQPKGTVGLTKLETAKKDKTFGSSQSGLAMGIIAEAKRKMRDGQELTEEDRDNLAFSQQVLSSPRIIRGPGGEMIEAAPLGVPERFSSVFRDTPLPQERTRGGAQIEPVSRQVERGSFKLTTLRAGADTFQKDFQNILSATQDIGKLLTEGRKEPGGITGAVGSAKAFGGGLARQVGIPVSGRAKQLQRRLEAIKAMAAKHVLGERGKTLSDQDRQRLDKIIGTLDAMTDEQDIRESLADVVKILMRMRTNGQR